MQGVGIGVGLSVGGGVGVVGVGVGIVGVGVGIVGGGVGVAAWGLIRRVITKPTMPVTIRSNKITTTDGLPRWGTSLSMKGILLWAGLLTGWSVSYLASSRVELRAAG